MAIVTKWVYFFSVAVKHILNARSITQVPAMAPACGLYLAHVKYDFSDNSEHGPNMDEESD